MNYLAPGQIEDLNFIRDILKNGGFEVQNITHLQSGSRSVAYYADNYVVRFPKAEIIWCSMQREKTVIDTVFPYLMPYFEGKIHKIELIDGEYPFSASKRFCGKICDGRPESEYAMLYQNLSAFQQNKLAQDIAMFFHLMHQIDHKSLNIPEPNETNDNWDVTTRDDFDFERIRQVLWTHGIDLNDYMPVHQNYHRALCHNDLSGSNILLNPDKENVLVGIIDFGNVVVMPKCLDFFPLYKIDRKLAIDTLTVYNQLTESKIEQKQTDFMVLTYIGYGLYRTKDKPSPYFLKLLKSFL